jgi:hypothetical protein
MAYSSEASATSNKLSNSPLRQASAFFSNIGLGLKGLLRTNILDLKVLSMSMTLKLSLSDSPFWQALFTNNSLCPKASKEKILQPINQYCQ